MKEFRIEQFPQSRMDPNLSIKKNIIEIKITWWWNLMCWIPHSWMSGSLCVYLAKRGIWIRFLGEAWILPVRLGYESDFYTKQALGLISETLKKDLKRRHSPELVKKV